MRKEEIVIDGEPVAKARPRFTRTGQVYTPEKSRRYERLVHDTFKGKPFQGAIYVKIEAYLKKPKINKSPFPTKKPDIDNIVKSILDGLNGKAWEDDKQVVKLTASKYWSDSPRVEVMIKEVVE